MDGFTLYAKVEAADLILALDELAKIHKANCKNSLERHEATAYVIYRGLQAIREDYDRVKRNVEACAIPSGSETRQ